MSIADAARDIFGFCPWAPDERETPMYDLSEYVFLDLETTGLDPNQDEILEIGLFHVDKEGTERSMSALLSFTKPYARWHSMVQQMHTYNGLYKELTEGPVCTRGSVLGQIATFISQCGFTEDRKPMMAGKSIHFDRAFIAEHLAIVDITLFSHRMMDVSSVNRALRLVDREPEKAELAHRALPDAIDAHRMLLACLGKMQDPTNDFRGAQKRAHYLAREKGWWDDYLKNEDGTIAMGIDTILSKLALIHSEVSEALEDARVGDMRTTISDFTSKGKPEGFPTEIADVVIRCFDLAEALGFSLADEVALKHEFNKTRSARHGGKLA